jgi:hypothetical protein
MSVPLIRQAMTAALKAITPTLDTAEEGKKYSPQLDSPYQRLDFFFAEPVNDEASGVYRQDGVMQVMLRYPAGEGPDAVEARAMMIRAAFPRGRSLPNGGVITRVERTPAITTAPIDGDRIVRVVRVRFYASNLT